MEPFDIAIKEYLTEILPVREVEIRPYAGVESLPYFLRDAYDVRELGLRGARLVMAIQRGGGKPSLASARTQLQKMEVITGLPVVYVASAMASYERKRLIEHHVPFLVPGNQLYLPDLGLDLREHFRKPRLMDEKALSPSAQAIVIAALVRRPWRDECGATELAGPLGYTAMTWSRASREIAETGIADVQVAGRLRQLKFAHGPRETWERIRPGFQSPIKRTVWAVPPASTQKSLARQAGQSALAAQSMLTVPRITSYAFDLAGWKAALHGGWKERSEPEVGVSEVQIWAYNPGILENSPYVDPLSLWLSLQATSDERVQSALDELMETLPW
jgi:hypothetical protein